MNTVNGPLIYLHWHICISIGKRVCVFEFARFNDKDDEQKKNSVYFLHKDKRLVH